ncbi:alkane hydroxylase MAH1-like protein [Tanacetum coccineum]
MAGPDLPQPFLRQHGFGIEKKLEKDGEMLDDVIGGLIARKTKYMSKEIVLKDDAKGVDLLTSMNTEQQSFTDGSKHDDKYLHDTILNLMIAGRDTTSSSLTWFLWLIVTHPEAEKRLETR